MHASWSEQVERPGELPWTVAWGIERLLANAAGAGSGGALARSRESELIARYELTLGLAFSTNVLPARVRGTPHRYQRNFLLMQTAFTYSTLQLLARR